MKRVIKQIITKIIILFFIFPIVWPIYSIAISLTLLFQFLKELFTTNNVTLDDIQTPREMWKTMIDSVKNWTVQ